MNTQAVNETPHALQSAAVGLAMIAVHEWGALGAHFVELRERFAVARRARNTGELLRDQMDLVPETQARLRQDQHVRRELLRRWVKTITKNSGLQQPAPHAVAGEENPRRRWRRRTTRAALSGGA